MGWSQSGACPLYILPSADLWRKTSCKNTEWQTKERKWATSLSRGLLNLSNNRCKEAAKAGKKLSYTYSQCLSVFCPTNLEDPNQICERGVGSARITWRDKLNMFVLSGQMTDNRGWIRLINMKSFSRDFFWVWGSHLWLFMFKSS